MSFTFNIAKGKVRSYADLASANDALVWIPLEATGLEADEVLKDYDTLTALLAGASNEQTTIGRVTLTNVTVEVDDAADEVQVHCDDFTLIGATGNPVGAVIVCYDPDTTVVDDTTVVPLWKHDAAFTPSGADIGIVVPESGIWASTD